MTKEEIKTERFTEWMPIDENALPYHLLICQWRHPEYGIIEGSLIRSTPEIPSSHQAWWIMPSDGFSAEIWLGEFTAYRKFIKKPKPIKAEPKESYAASLEAENERLRKALEWVEQKLNVPATQICLNCGADYGLHRSSDCACPLHGLEISMRAFDRGEHQQWQDTFFEDKGQPDVYSALTIIEQALNPTGK